MLLVVLVCLPGLGAGQTDGGGTGAVEDDAIGRRQSKIRLFPSDALYPRYLADPHAPATGVVVQFFSTTAIEQASDRRQHIKLGGIFPLLGWGGRREGGRRWQLRLDGGLDAQFDPENQTDNTGWDGNYGLMVESHREEKGIAFRVGVFHISAHLGDEWIERTGRQRLMYRREEILAGAARSWRPGSRVYVEAGWAYDELNSSLQDPARAQAGVEIEGRRPLRRKSVTWYAALDLSAWEERDWRLDTGAQLGLVTRPQHRAWRFGLQYWDGRVPLGEFFQETESNLSIGLWTDL